MFATTVCRHVWLITLLWSHMNVMASQIKGNPSVCLTICSSKLQTKQRYPLLTFMRVTTGNRLYFEFCMHNASESNNICKLNYNSELFWVNAIEQLWWSVNIGSVNVGVFIHKTYISAQYNIIRWYVTIFLYAPNTFSVIWQYSSYPKTHIMPHRYGSCVAYDRLVVI